MTKTLFNITLSYNDLMTRIEEAEGVLTEEMIQELEITEKDIQVKSIAYLEVIKQKEALNIVIDEEIKRLQAFKKRNESVTSSLKTRLLSAVNLFGDIIVGTHTFTTRKSESIFIENEDNIPKEFKVSKVSVMVDKVAIKKAIKEGKEVKGAILQENKNLYIK